MIIFQIVKFNDVDYQIPSMWRLLEVEQIDHTFTLEDFKAVEWYLL